MSCAFYLAPQAWGEKMELCGEEARHAHALRLKAGDEALLLDGAGRIGHCRVESVKKRSVSLMLEKDDLYMAPQSRAIMAIALGKAVRRGFFMEKAAELGAWAIWFWQAERSQGKISGQVLEASRNRLIAGMKQSLNPWLPELAAFDDASSMAAAAAPCERKIVPWEEESSKNMLLPDQLGLPGRTVYAIGPEGGITTGEMDTLKNAGFMPASLGRRVLRCETAATLCLGLHWWASQLPMNTAADAGMANA